MKGYLDVLGNPHLNLKFVHVTGTNGKGSTCAMLAQILQEAGYKVGLFTSPHLYDWRERVQINGQKITDEAIRRIGAQILEFQIGIFEAWFLMAMAYFQSEAVDIVILEAGIGGRLDTTNLIPSPEVSVITNIGLDHTDVLGDSKESITLEKAGIVKDSILVTGILEPELRALLPPHRVVFAEGTFKEKNEALVREVLRVLKEKDWMIPDEAIESGIQNTDWPLRLQVLSNEPFILADGGHNVDGVKALKEALPKRGEGRRILLMGISSDKDANQMAPLLAEGMDEVVVSEASYHATSAERLATLVPGAQSIPNLKKAVDDLQSSLKKEDQLFILGSLYFVSEAVSMMGLVDPSFNKDR